MTKVVGIRFQRAGKIYYFDPLDYDLEVPMHVIVETARGVEMGTVLIAPKEVEDDQVVQPLKPVIRIATDEDEKVMERNKEKQVEAFKICKEKIAKHGLEMKLRRSIRLIITSFCSILRQTDESISVNWLRIWLRCSVPESSCARSVSAMRQRCSAELESAEESFAVSLI